MGGKVYVDSSAALGFAGRSECGETRHIKMGMQWIRDKAEEGAMEDGRQIEAVTSEPGDLQLAQRIKAHGYTGTARLPFFAKKWLQWQKQVRWPQQLLKTCRSSVYHHR